MNVNENPTIDQLRELLAAQDDRAGHHKIWVSNSGEVQVTCLPWDVSPAQWMYAHQDDVRYCYETLDRGNGWVGQGAAGDDWWVKRLFGWLVGNWDGKPTASPLIPVLPHDKPLRGNMRARDLHAAFCEALGLGGDDGAA
jgi:hypothetical protein